jgi:hypothetical protein
MGTLTDSDAFVPYKESLKFSASDPTFNSHYGENQKYPDVVVSEQVPGDFSFEVHNLSKANLAKFIGGTADGTTETWSDGTDHFSIEQSMEVDTIFDETWQYARVLLSGVIKYDADRKNIAKIAVKGMILNPEDATGATPPMKKIPTPA